MPVRQNPGAQLKNEKTGPSRRSYDQSAVNPIVASKIWPLGGLGGLSREITSNKSSPGVSYH
jgi:hypothetical protein